MRRALFPLAALLAAGCGDGRPKTVAFDGRLEYSDGSPVEGATVTFSLPKENGEFVGAQGLAGPGGAFRLTTFEPGDGALPGEHRVTVVSVPGGDAGGAAPIPGRYSGDDSGLKATVTPETKSLTVKIDKAKGKK